MKTCRVCKTEKETSEFSKEKSRPDGLQSVCKECQKVSAKLFKERNPGYFDEKGRKAYATRYKFQNKERYLKYQEKYLANRAADLQTVRGRIYSVFAAARDRASKYGLPFDITLDWLFEQFNKADGRCAVTGIPLTTNLTPYGARFHHPFNPSIDQIKAGKGYTMDNTRIVAVMVNLALNKFGDAAFDAMCEAYMAKKAMNKVMELV
jgi:hypothetical protein